MKTKNHKGFTLIELLVVLAIITLIFSLILASMSTARKKARDSQRVQDFAEFRKALELYYNQFGMYPCGDSSIGPTYYIDSSGSCPFLDGESYSGMNPPTSCSTFHSDILSCGYPEFGISRAGFYSQHYQKDPLESWPSYSYIYTVNIDRSAYLLQTRLEANPDRMQKDGGLCNNRYEFGPGLGDSNLTRESEAWFTGSCN